MSWRMTDWITASMQHQERERSGDREHGAVLALEPARREVGAASCSRSSSPTLPVTQTAAFVTQAVTPRMTKSPRLGGASLDRAGDGVADVADDRQVARVGTETPPPPEPAGRGGVGDAALRPDVDRELALRLPRRAPVRGGRILVAELDPEGPVPALRGSAADEAVRGERETRRQGAVEDPELVGERGAAAAVSLELVEVARPDRPVRHLVAVVREPDRRGARHDHERERTRQPAAVRRSDADSCRLSRSAHGSARSNSSKRGIAANSSPGALGDLGGGERRRRPGGARERADLPGAVLPDERDDLRPPRLLRLDGGAAADDADVPDRDRGLVAARSARPGSRPGPSEARSPAEGRCRLRASLVSERWPPRRPRSAERVTRGTRCVRRPCEDAAGSSRTSPSNAVIDRAAAATAPARRSRRVARAGRSRAGCRRSGRRAIVVRVASGGWRSGRGDAASDRDADREQRERRHDADARTSPRPRRSR